VKRIEQIIWCFAPNEAVKVHNFVSKISQFGQTLAALEIGFAEKKKIKINITITSPSICLRANVSHKIRNLYVIY
jgi:hypothetical protein